MHAQDFTFWPAGTHHAKTLVTAGAVKQCLSKNWSSKAVACAGIARFASSSG